MKKIILFTNIIFIAVACNKKESQPVDTTPPNNQPSIVAIIPNGLSAINASETCNLNSWIYYYNTNNVITKDSSLVANFQSNAATSGSYTNVFAGSVTCNSLSLSINTLNPQPNVYSSPGACTVNLTSNLSWSVQGSGTVTAFGIAFVPSYPKYTGGSSLPDTCSKASGITINVTGLSNCQNFSNVLLTCGSQFAFKTLSPANGSVTFSNAELANFTPNQPLAINIGVGNYFGATINGLRRGFGNGINYRKNAYLKP